MSKEFFKSKPLERPHVTKVNAQILKSISGDIKTYSIFDSSGEQTLVKFRGDAPADRCSQFVTTTLERKGILVSSEARSSIENVVPMVEQNGGWYGSG